MNSLHSLETVDEDTHHQHSDECKEYSNIYGCIGLQKIDNGVIG